MTRTPAQVAAQLRASRAAKPSIAARNAAAREALIDEVTFMLDSGESPARTALRLGYAKAESLERRLLRAERPDLAAIFRPAYNRDRHKQAERPCRAGCGNSCGRASRIQICRACCDRYGVGPAIRNGLTVEQILTRIVRVAV